MRLKFIFPSTIKRPHTIQMQRIGLLQRLVFIIQDFLSVYPGNHIQGVPSSPPKLCTAIFLDWST